MELMDLLEEQLTATQRRLIILAQQGDLVSLEPDDPLHIALTELSHTMLELEVSVEQMQIQHEQLIHTRQTMENERARYQELFDRAPDSYMVTDTHGIIREANQAAQTLLNVSSQNIVGKPLSVFVSMGERREFRTWLQDLRLDENVKWEHVKEVETVWETQLQPRDAAAFPADLTVTALFDAKGRLTDLRWRLRDIAERQESNAALRREEAFSQSVLKSMNAHIAVLDKDGVIVAVNDAWIRFARENGISSAPRIGVDVNYLDVCRCATGDFADEAPLAADGIEGVLSGALEQFSLEYPCSSPTEERWFLMNVVPLQNGDSSAVVTHIDVTSRRQTEEALRHSEARNRALLEAIPDTITRMHRDGTILDATAPADGSMLSWDESVIGKNQRDLLPPDVAEQIHQRDQWVLETGMLQTLEYEIQIEGNKRIRESRAVPVGKDEVISIARDITERRQQEEALRQSEKRNRALLDAIPDAILRIDRKGTYLDIKAPTDFTPRVPVEEMIGKHQRDILPAETARVMMYHNDQALKTGKLQTFEFDLELAGERFIRESRVVPSGEDEVTIIVRDVTERRRAQAKERRLSEEVSEQRERLRALNQRLAETQESERRQLARELHDQVGQNLSTLGLNLNIVQAQALTSLPGTEQIQMLLTDSKELLKQTTERVRNVMADLRPPVLDDYGLPAALDWYANRIARRGGFSVVVEAEDSIQRLPEAVENTLFRIAQEAITNIMKHAQATQVTVRLTGDSDMVSLTIVDNGRGFDPTQLVSALQSERWGLLTMRERAEAVGGHFDIESQNGNGTAVRLAVEL